MNQDKAAQWFDEVTKGEAIYAVAKKAGVPQTTLNRQVLKQSFTIGMVVAVARCYQVSPIKALVDLEVLTEQEVSDRRDALKLESVPNEALAEEVYARLTNRPSSPTPRLLR